MQNFGSCSMHTLSEISSTGNRFLLRQERKPAGQAQIGCILQRDPNIKLSQIFWTAKTKQCETWEKTHLCPVPGVLSSIVVDFVGVALVVADTVVAVAVVILCQWQSETIFIIAMDFVEWTVRCVQRFMDSALLTGAIFFSADRKWDLFTAWPAVSSGSFRKKKAYLPKQDSSCGSTDLRCGWPVAILALWWSRPPQLSPNLSFFGPKLAMACSQALRCRY